MTLCRFVIITLTAVLIISCSQNTLQSNLTRNNFPDVLNIKNAPKFPGEDSLFCFFDLGSWNGFALPDKDNPSARMSFAGPFMMNGRNWLSRRILKLELFDKESEKISFPEAGSYSSEYLPGIIRQSATAGGLRVCLELFFISDKTALILAEIKNTSGAEKTVSVRFSGEVFRPQFKLKKNGSRITVLSESGGVFYIYPQQGSSLSLENEGADYSISASVAENLSSNSSVFSFAVLSSSPEARLGLLSVDDVLKYRHDNKVRWNKYIANVFAGLRPRFKTVEYKTLAVKCLITLVSNWKASIGGLFHAGIIPSYAINYFNGFWAWDSWKHAAAAARFAPDLAVNQIRAMFDYQNDSGMIPDVIYPDTSENNWRDSKPPLAAWAVSEIYKSVADKNFVLEIYPKLKQYHYYWYANRDHDGNGLCEYGSTDGTLTAAKWESGMDNAARFDDAEMVQNSPGAWSMNLESVDLNSYLYAEKIYLSEMANLLGFDAEADSFRSEAKRLRSKINETMFDKASGFYYDVKLESKKKIKTAGPEGWIPLWAGVAEKAEAAAVSSFLLNEKEFNTFVPFPTVSKISSEYSLGYWRGPVWLDQAYFALAGLRRYGYYSEADSLTNKLLTNAKGLLSSDLPIRENYDPETGAGLNVNHFSWSAAHLLLMMSSESPN